MWQESLTLKAPAKINLYLRVTGRRVDGYHTLETLMQKVSLYDEIEVRLCERGVRLHCSDDALPANSDNLVFRAAELFLQTIGLRQGGSMPGVEIFLKKNIPVAAGLGGGSSDAAATLKGLNALLGCGCSDEELAGIGLRLGADVPFFLAETGTALATGIGELLTPVAPLAAYSILLVNPGFPVSTPWVYQTFALTKPENAGRFESLQKRIGAAGGLDVSNTDWAQLAAIGNDLERVTVAKYPEIDQLKNELVNNGAATALMSGSGPTVFGLFVNRQKAEACHDIFQGRYKHSYLVSPLSGKE